VCGIFGYVGPRPVVPVLLDGLRRLEYRGYDSAGVAVQAPGGLVVAKRRGRVAALAEALGEAPGPQGLGAGIGHTRWATHGSPSDANAHPHADEAGRIALVHNGIVENHAALRAELAARGHTLASETDSEAVVHLVEEALHRLQAAAGDGQAVAPFLRAAVQQAVQRLRGSFALAVLAPDAPVVVGVRHEAPLVVGLGEGEAFLASDVTALLPYTRDVLVLEDGEIAELTPEGATLYGFDGRRRPHRPPERVAWDADAAERGGYAHFMLKEIHEQPRAARDTLRGRLGSRGPELPELAPWEGGTPERVVLLGCGTAHHAGLVARAWLERWARLPAEAALGSEFRYQEPLLAAGTWAVAVSQSGETADTLAAARHARSLGAPTLAVVNVVGSTLAREADAALYTRAGPEIAVASTKAYTSQLLVLALLALWAAARRGAPPEALAARQEALAVVPDLLAGALALEPAAEALGVRLAAHEHVFYLGRGLDWAAAVEGQLKLKEVSYVHAEACPAGELKHGTLALVAPGTPVVALATQPHLAAKTAANLAEVRARGGWVAALATPTTRDAVAPHADEVLVLPEAPDPDLAPVVAAVPLQLVAYHAARARGLDVDRPRNLAKSVTVE
jgi:glucosamine--fructose-6-phosphate aminotransferase (isomerizing)